MGASAEKNRLSPEERDVYAKKHAGLVKHIASRIAMTLPSHVDTEDLLHDGVVGLMDALHRFDPSKGIQFKTFVSNRIRGAILDALRSKDFASRGARRRLRELNKAEETLCHRLGRYPERAELAQELSITEGEIERRRNESKTGFVGSLQESRLRNEEGETWLDSLADDGPSVDALADKATKKQLLKEGLKTLKERDRLLLSLYYFEDLNIREIAAILEVSEARVSQLHGRALKKLREYLENTSLETLKVAH